MAGTSPAMTRIAMIIRPGSIVSPLQKFSCLAAVLVLAGIASAIAAEPRPDVAVKTKYIDASVTLDKQIRANAPLADNLLAEGKHWIEKNRADAAKEFKTSPELFGEGRAWTFERSYAQTSNVGGRYVSIVRTDYIYTGGAHPNTLIDTILWDQETKKQISIRPFFKETADNGPTLKALRDAAVAAVKAKKKERGIDDSGAINWYESVEPTLLKVGAVSLAPSVLAGKSAGLVFHYSPYAVGSYAEGSYTVFVPWEAFRKHLSPQGLEIFGGDRPANTKPGSE
ncbi:hypothetical protein NB311A_17961 [Nitrobacter sp. Nb-311A]|nr:hypothetical protein NB311A_17961 [Nitrobacter sp. Nb-311A]